MNNNHPKINMQSGIPLIDAVEGGRQLGPGFRLDHMYDGKIGVFKLTSIDEKSIRTYGDKLLEYMDQYEARYHGTYMMINLHDFSDISLTAYLRREFMRIDTLSRQRGYTTPSRSAVVIPDTVLGHMIKMVISGIARRRPDHQYVYYSFSRDDALNKLIEFADEWLND